MIKFSLLARIILVVSLLTSVLSGPTTRAQAQDSGPTREKSAPAVTGVPTNQIIIKFKASAEATGLEAASASHMSALSQTAGVALNYFRAMSGEAHVLKLPQALPYADVQAIVKKLAARPDVEYAEPDRRMFPMATPNDPSYSSQWHYFAPTAGTYGANLPAAWDVITGSTNIRIAVLDTGILSGHPDLSGRTVSGYDFISDAQVGNDGDGRDANPEDPGDWITSAEDSEVGGFFEGCGVSDSSWHGSHVAGTIGAATNNSTGVAGINWVSKIQAVRVLGKCGGFTSDIADGIRWAAGLTVSGVTNNANPSRVINMSLGGSGACDTTTQNAVNDAVNAGTVVVVAAGNSNANASGFSPASCNNVITVASNDRDGNRAYYSNYGTVVDITAPGGETNITSSNGVLSTLNAGTTSPAAHNYVYYQGTSMATPHVAGVVSLMLSVNPALTPAQVTSLLQTNVTAFPGGSNCNTTDCGPGILNAAAAVQAAQNAPSLDKFTYLPLISKNHPALPSVISNGDFEQGAAAWTQFSQQNVLPLILTQSSSPDPLPIAPHSGVYAVWLGGVPNEVNYVQQGVSVSSGQPYLYYWHWIASQDIPNFDFGYVQINGATVDSLSLSSSVNTGGWVKRVVNLNSYTGQTVTLRIIATTNSLANSNWFIDDVGFQATP